ncbi:unnamed protein product, partial [Didymodactylos carnosus]
ILNNLGLIATISGGLIAGSTLYFTNVEAPSVMRLGVEEYWRYIPLMYYRAVTQFVSLLSISGLSAFGHVYYHGKNLQSKNIWLTAGSIMIGIMPYTIIFMMPTLKIIRQKEENIVYSLETKKNLINKLTRLHLLRTIGSCVAFSLMVYCIAKH